MEVVEMVARGREVEGAGYKTCIVGAFGHS